MLPDYTLPEVLEQGAKNDPALSPVGPYGHGDGGLFTGAPGDPMFSAILMPIGGAMDAIPVIRRDPAGDGDSTLFGGEMVALDTLLTGVTKGDADEFENQPTTDCADGPVGGLTKLCTMVNPFGRFRVGTREVSMYRAGQRLDHCDPEVITVLNVPQMREFMGLPDRTPSTRNALNNEILRRMWESAVSFRRMFAERVWIGSPANNVGERRDITGLDIHINAGNKIDYQSSSVCVAADSDVKDFGYSKITATDGRNLVEYMESAEDWTIGFKADQQGLTPVTGWIFMRPEVWRDVSAVWPIKQYQQAMGYLATSTPGQIVINANEAFNERERFRRNRILPLNGRNYEVVIDNTMPFETSNETGLLLPGQYASDIVFVPRTVMGSIPVTFFEYFNHNNQQAMTIQRLVGGGLTFTTDNGRFRFYVNFKNGCMNMTWEFSPRLKVKTPQLGWRIQNVVAEPLQMYPSFDPDSSYFANGGNTGDPNAGQRYYTPWSTETPVAI